MEAGFLLIGVTSRLLETLISHPNPMPAKSIKDRLSAHLHMVHIFYMMFLNFFPLFNTKSTRKPAIGTMGHL